LNSIEPVSGVKLAASYGSLANTVHRIDHAPTLISTAGALRVVRNVMLNALLTLTVPLVFLLLGSAIVARGACMVRAVRRFFGVGRVLMAVTAGMTRRHGVATKFISRY